MTIATTEATDLALDQEQSTWTDRQRTALAHIGVEDASEGDLEVFFHVVKRTGLDPFARQIYMIARQVSEKRGSEWVKVTKQTIQTGIDGFRLIGRRAADRAGHTLSVQAPEWASDDGQWRPVWTKAWGTPLAARVTIVRNGETFTAVTMFDEYAQTKRDGALTQMWAQRPAGQIAKCAEAAAWRMAFPQDLSGIYADDEMHRAEYVDRAPERRGGIAAALADPEPAPAPDDPLLDTKSALAKAMFAAINEAGITDKERLPWINDLLGREIASSKDMTEADARKVLDTLNSPPWTVEPAGIPTPDPHDETEESA